ncbi:MAG: phosphate ABC transporter substrate-binding protein PstS [Aphanocapsa sp. GSE-SYN-MK-11-07L]|nr:phosphate ABC transporter substrate-binding protein PstS [Aphanocapsa sp. GSE-SYN-MK-11-07L]
MRMNLTLSGLATPLAVATLTFGLVSCGGGSPTPTADAPPGTAPIVEGKVSLTGAGASFPAPLYQRWFSDFNKKNPNVTISYQSVGSGAGVEQFTKGTVDFGASDVAMKDDEIAKVERGVLMLPMTAGAIVLTYNLPEVKTPIKLSRQTYTDIFLGKITQWNDPKIAADNQDLTLPDKKIQVVHRSDGSGTTGIFTKHLSAISPEWKQKVGDGKTVSWPTGVGGKGNEGVTAQVQQLDGAIGYVEFGYASQNGLQMAALQNKEGTFVEPTADSFKATLSAIELPANMRAFESDPAGKDSYPIVSYTWLLAYKQYDDPNKLKALQAAIDYGLTEGQQVSAELGYVPLPESVVAKVEAAKAEMVAKK